MVTAPGFYNLKDQGIYSAGDFFIPQERYRAGPYASGQPNNPDDVPSGIPAVYQSQGGSGSDGFNVYNPDMSRVRTDFRPEYDFRRFSEYGVNPSTMDRKQMDMNQDYFYEPPKTGLEQLASKAINFVPFIGTASRIAGAFADKLPINQRAILENQLRGQGVFTDDIGRIVAGPGGYNTPEGIMAGYNASQMNEGTFDKRTDRISQTLGDKYGISKNDIQGLIDGTVTDEDIENKYGITTNLTSNIRNINLAKQNFITTQNRAIEIEKFKEAERIRKESERQYDPGRHGSTNYGLGSDGQQSYSGDALGGKDLGFGINATTGGPVSNRSGRGRTDYMDGGLADMLEIYD